MQWSSTYPDHPGYYWLSEAGEAPFIVKVDVESDSHGMFFVQFPGNDQKYPFELWPGARWLGPFETPPRSVEP